MLDWLATSMPTITIDPKHARLQAFLAGKRIQKTDKPVEVEVSDTELTALVGRAKQFGFEDLIKVKKADLKKAEKAQENPKAAEPRDAEPSDETTADQEAEEAEEDSPKTPRRRRA